VANAFLDSTVVRRSGAGTYAAEVDPRWNLRPLPQGGVVTALAVRAMQAELGAPAQRLRTLHTTFAAQVAHGPVGIDVEVLRRGRSMSQLRAEVRNVGAARGHVTSAVFGSSREGFAFTDQRPPAGIPSPQECPSFRDPPPPHVEPFDPMPFWTHVEGRPALGHAWWEHYEPERAERAGWYRFDEPPIGPDGTLDVGAVVTLCDFMPGALGEKVGGTGPVERPWFAPSVDLTVHLLGDCRSEWVLCHNTARHAGEGYASADMALWDCGDDGLADPRLVAHATQVFFFTFIDGGGAGAR
jgi:acyl-CoA thioesterase